MNTEEINTPQEPIEETVETKKRPESEHMARFREILAQKHGLPKELKEKIMKFRESLSRSR